MPNSFRVQRRGGPHRAASPGLVNRLELEPLGQGLQEFPGDARVRLHQGAELPRRQAVAAELGLCGDRRSPGALGDQGDLAEVVSGAEATDLVAVDLDLRLAVA